ncbi:uncharacterized protein LOC106069403 isoform X2 [Biomphalaria glabrata]|uniref:Uncharacterized protein LOC106069403 isoform X2 n=1 Tax=Biomphalaria glabrata TaxID=6526 RepID=A0A9W3BFZ8_BIOGL|nr:uncharacterized protein LOC106069403 isoform X2 [Biomphalaria glabrata]KAI8778969.1 E3 SUMO-protein ligase ZNF451 [Biomphalaria glabrata]
MASLTNEDSIEPECITEHLSSLFTRLSANWKTHQSVVIRNNQLDEFRNKFLVWMKQAEDSFVALTRHTETHQPTQTRKRLTAKRGSGLLGKGQLRIRPPSFATCSTSDPQGSQEEGQQRISPPSVAKHSTKKASTTKCDKQRSEKRKANFREGPPPKKFKLTQEGLQMKHKELVSKKCQQTWNPVPENQPLGFANRVFPEKIADTESCPGLQITRSLVQFNGKFMDNTFVYGLFVSSSLGDPTEDRLYCELNKKKCVHISNDIGTSKNAVGFALALLIPKMDDRVPASVPFFILSASDGLKETVRQLNNVRRKIKVITPRAKVSSEDFVL